MNDNVHVLEGGHSPDKAAEDMRKLRNNLATIIEAQAFMAQVTKAKYDALIAQGFTAAQALELCK